MSDYITDYLSGVWCANDPVFIQEFIKYCKDDKRQWDFVSGENGYCGYTAYIKDCYHPFDGWRFEFAYAKDFVRVFDANNEGYWVPEMISLDGEEAQELLGIMKEKLLKFAGF